MNPCKADRVFTSRLLNGHLNKDAFVDVCCNPVHHKLSGQLFPGLTLDYFFLNLFFQRSHWMEKGVSLWYIPLCGYALKKHMCLPRFPMNIVILHMRCFLKTNCRGVYKEHTARYDSIHFPLPHVLQQTLCWSCRLPCLGTNATLLLGNRAWSNIWPTSTHGICKHYWRLFGDHIRLKVKTYIKYCTSICKSFQHRDEWWKHKHMTIIFCPCTHSRVLTILSIPGVLKREAWAIPDNPIMWK